MIKTATLGYKPFFEMPNAHLENFFFKIFRFRWRKTPLISQKTYTFVVHVWHPTVKSGNMKCMFVLWNTASIMQKKERLRGSPKLVSKTYKCMFVHDFVFDNMVRRMLGKKWKDLWINELNRTVVHTFHHVLKSRDATVYCLVSGVSH